MLSPSACRMEENEPSVQGHTGGSTTKGEEAGATIPSGNSEILGGQKSSSGNGEKGTGLRNTEKLSLVELGDLLAWGMRERAMESKLIFRLMALSIPLDLNTTWQQPGVVSYPQLSCQSMEPGTLINYPDATYRSSSLITTICL